jgi:glycosyl-4,4'-diaponeurosporenoate acyltransferase
MLFHLPRVWVITLDIVMWVVIHMGVSYTVTRMPVRYFNPEAWLYKKRKWEKEGRLYEALFGVKRWKGLLPDGAAIFKGGFTKKKLKKSDDAYLRRFLKETCRGELAHWITILCSPIFFLWNLWWVGLIMIAYALIADIPCIITQRFNRIRFRRIVP